MHQRIHAGGAGTAAAHGLHQSCRQRLRLARKVGILGHLGKQRLHRLSLAGTAGCAQCLAQRVWLRAGLGRQRGEGRQGVGGRERGGVGLVHRHIPQAEGTGWGACMFCHSRRNKPILILGIRQNY
jgi:hypothetical protein